jgi:hypothetical protein
MAPRVGFEPTTDRLTADCSTTELPRIMNHSERWEIANCKADYQPLFTIALMLLVSTDLRTNCYPVLPRYQRLSSLVLLSPPLRRQL